MLNLNDLFSDLKEMSFAELENINFDEFSLDERVNAFVNSSDYIKSIADSVVNPMLENMKPFGFNERESALIGCYYRAFLWMETFVTLKHPKHFQAAASGARSLFEVWVDMEILNKDLVNKAVEKYNAFAAVDRYRSAKRRVEKSKEFPGLNLRITAQQKLVNDRGESEKIEALFDEIWNKKVNYKYHWSGENLAERVKFCSDDIQKEYYERYAMFSWYVHSGASGYAHLNKETLKLCFTDAHILAQRAFLSCLKIIVEEMKLAKAVQPLSDHLEKIKLTPGLLLLKMKSKNIPHE